MKTGSPRRVTSALKGAETMDAQRFSDALIMGSEAAYKAVMRPKEGTILTVSRAYSVTFAGEPSIERFLDHPAFCTLLVVTILDEPCMEIRRAGVPFVDVLLVLRSAGVWNPACTALSELFTH